MARSYRRDAKGRFARTGSSRKGSSKRSGLSSKSKRRLKTATKIGVGVAAAGFAAHYAVKGAGHAGSRRDANQVRRIKNVASMASDMRQPLPPRSSRSSFAPISGQKAIGPGPTGLQKAIGPGPTGLQKAAKTRAQTDAWLSKRKSRHLAAHRRSHKLNAKNKGFRDDMRTLIVVNSRGVAHPRNQTMIETAMGGNPNVPRTVRKRRVNI